MLSLIYDANMTKGIFTEAKNITENNKKWVINKYNWILAWLYIHELLITMHNSSINKICKHKNCISHYWNFMYYIHLVKILLKFIKLEMVSKKCY